MATILIDKEATFGVDHLAEIVLVIICEARIALEWGVFRGSVFLLIGALVGACRRVGKCGSNLERALVVGVGRRGWLSGGGLLLAEFTLTSLGYLVS